MGNGSKAVTGAVLFYAVLVMAKNGTLNKLVGQVSTGVQTVGTGFLKPISQAA